MVDISITLYIISARRRFSTFLQVGCPIPGEVIPCEEQHSSLRIALSRRQGRIEIG